MPHLLLPALAVLVIAGGSTVAGAVLTQTGPTTEAAMDSWVSHYGAALTGISHDSAAVGADRAALTTDTPKFRADCEKVLTDVHVARNSPAMPTAVLQDQWSSALSHFARGAEVCEQGVDQRSPVLLVEAQMHFAHAGTDFQSLARAIQNA